MWFRVTLQGNYRFRKTLNLIRKYQGKQFSELQGNNFCMEELRVILCELDL